MDSKYILETIEEEKPYLAMLPLNFKALQCEDMNEIGICSLLGNLKASKQEQIPQFIGSITIEFTE